MTVLLFPPPAIPSADGKMAKIMDGLAGLIAAAAPTANVFGWPVESIQPPAVVVGFPTSWEFDASFGSSEVGTAIVPVWFVVGRSSTKESRNALSDIMSSTSSVKAILDGLQTFGDVRVTGAEVSELSVAGVAYLAAKFDCEVYA